MLTECKCGNPVEAKLDVETDKVMCQNCNKEIENISDFTKHSMKLRGDVVKHEAGMVPPGGMKVECSTCHKPMVALLDKRDDECYCPKCNAKVALSGLTKALLRENGQYAGNNNIDAFDGDKKTEKVAQVVQIDENGILGVVDADQEEEFMSPFDKLQQFQAARAAEEAKQKKEAQASHKVVTATAATATVASPVSITIVGSLEKPATVAELVEARKKLEAQIKEAKAIEKASAPKRGRGRPKKTQE